MYIHFVTLCFIISSGYGKPMANPVLLEYQDSTGQYSFGYSAPQSARSEIRSADGFTRGAFSYVDDAGVIQTAKYTADSVNGFRIEASNLPESPNPVEDTPEVIAARLEHLRAHQTALENDGVKNLQGDKLIGETLSDGVAVSKVALSSQKKIDNIIAEERSSISQSTDSISSQVPHQVKSEGSTEIRQEMPMVEVSSALPSNNINVNSFKLDASNLSTPPNPVEDTPEVMVARLEHLRARLAAMKNVEGKNLQGDGLIDDTLSDKIVAFKTASSNQNKIDDAITEKHSTISQSIDPISSQVSQQMELKEKANVRQEIPVVKTSLVLPKSNVNIQNRIELRAMDLSTSDAPLHSMSQDIAEVPMKTMVQSEMMNYDPKTVILRSVQRLPTVYSHTQYLHFVPTYYF